ncbi:response regulator, partial [Ferrovum sp.]
MRILLVEDDDMIAEAVTLALRDHAYAVDRIANGLAVSGTLQDSDYQAVLLDLGLPGRDGLEVLRRLRL